MAVVEFDLDDLGRLAGRKLKKEDLERLEMMGFPLERLEEKKVSYEVFPNRPDMLSIEGFARAARSFLGAETGMGNYRAGKSGVKLHVDKSVASVRPYIAAAILKGGKLNESALEGLIQLQEKLHDTFGRKRKKVAIGIHDMSRVEGPFSYRAVSRDAVRFVPLGMSREMTPAEILGQHQKGIEYSHLIRDKVPLLADSKGRVLSMPPVINGELTRLTAGSRELLIDVTGTQLHPILDVLNIISAALCDRGFSAYSLEIVYGRDKITTPDLSPARMKVDIGYAERLLGLDLEEKDVSALLLKMGIGYEKGYAVIPPYRVDILHQIDLVEEMAIAYGYMNFRTAIPPIPSTASRQDENDFRLAACGAMQGLGFQEILSMVLSNSESFRKSGVDVKSAGIKNSVSSECTIVRTRLLPGILKSLAQNKGRSYPQHVFEAGDVVVLDSGAETGAREIRNIAAAIAGTNAGYESIAPVLKAFLASFGIEYRLEELKDKAFIEGRAASVLVNGKDIGSIGEVSLEVLENWGIEMPVALFEISLEAVYGILKRGRQ
ncbi:MAG: phenylalanine--tRNA ligase subunit beta [Candidatus Aenigmarchaeota archaeon]|nr:phenylalanine--tRNA ligase subunit beta [Candidatus Aenigmarchaeota archaeon]